MRRMPRPVTEAKRCDWCEVKGNKVCGECRDQSQKRSDARKEDTMIILNGKEKEQYSDLSLTELLELEGYDSRKIAVEINGEIISKSIYNETRVKSGDKVEVVSFVGGG